MANPAKSGSVELPTGAVADAVVLAGAATAAGATTAALTSTVGTAAAAVASASSSCLEQHLTGDPERETRMDVCQQDGAYAEPVPWDAHLDNPSVQTDTMLQPAMQVSRKIALGLISDDVSAFVEAHEFVSLGCYCAPSYALQLLGLKKYSYPFDWVRSGLEGVIHCMDVQFQDFLTYSTCWNQDQYMVFGGTRWGGSFWHHNLEAAITREDMGRRVERFYGRGEVPACKPRFFVRSVNSTRELEYAVRLREALQRALPSAGQVLLLLIVDLQSSTGPLRVAGEEGNNVLIYQISEAETSAAIAQGARGLKVCSEGYARAISFAIRYWAGDSDSQSSVRLFLDTAQLSAACEQWDGGDPARELFTPRKFYGQQLNVLPGIPKMQKLFAPFQVFNFVLQANVDITAPLQLQCFGRMLEVRLPQNACSGHVLQLFLHNGQLSGNVILMMAGGQTVPVGMAAVTERFKH